MSQEKPPPHDPVPWTDLIRGCLAGDRKAETTFFTEARQIVFRLYRGPAFRMNRFDADDSSSELIFLFVRNNRRLLAAYDVAKNSSFRAHLIFIARRFGVRRMRSREFKDGLRWDDLADHAETLPSAPATDAWLGVLDIEKAIAQLSPTHQLLVEMKNKGRTNAEIAEALGKTHGATEQDIFRMRRELRKLLGANDA